MKFENEKLQSFYDGNVYIIPSKEDKELNKLFFAKCKTIFKIEKFLIDPFENYLHIGSNKKTLYSSNNKHFKTLTVEYFLDLISEIDKKDPLVQLVYKKDELRFCIDLYKEPDGFAIQTISNSELELKMKDKAFLDLCIEDAKNKVKSLNSKSEEQIEGLKMENEKLQEKIYKLENPKSSTDK